MSFPSASALLLNTNDEVLGGLNAHAWSSSSYRLFNNLFVLPGVSSKPLSLNLINGLIGTLNSQAIGFPNDLARIPYRRCKFLALDFFRRFTFSISSVSPVQLSPQPLVFNKELYRIVCSIRNKSFIGSFEMPSYSFFSIRYNNILKDRDYYSLVYSESGVYKACAFLSHFKPANKLHILYLDYIDFDSALHVLSAANQFANKLTLSLDCIFNCLLEQPLVDLLTISKSSNPIIGHGIKMPFDFFIRDGDNDVY